MGSKVLSSKVPGNMRKTPLGIPIYLEDNEHTDVVNRDAWRTLYHSLMKHNEELLMHINYWNKKTDEHTCKTSLFLINYSLFLLFSLDKYKKQALPSDNVVSKAACLIASYPLHVYSTAGTHIIANTLLQKQNNTNIAPITLCKLSCRNKIK